MDVPRQIVPIKANLCKGPRCFTQVWSGGFVYCALHQALLFFRLPPTERLQH